MSDQLSALLVTGKTQLFDLLRSALRDLSIHSHVVQTCKEAGQLLDRTQPQMVFAATSLEDGSWKDILQMAQKARSKPDLIVVSPTSDVKLYVSAMEQGAFDFIVPPFEQEGLSYVVRSAQLDVAHRRAESYRTAVA